MTKPIALLALLALLLFPTIAQAQSPTDLPTYTQLLREANAAAQRRDQVGLRVVADQLAVVRTVQLPDGSQAPVDTGWLSTAIAAPDPDWDSIDGRLGALVTTYARTGVGTPNAEAQLRQVFNEPPFSTQSSEPSWLAQQYERFVRWIDSVLNSFGLTSPMVGGPVAVFGTFVGLVLLLAVGVTLFRGLRRTSAAEAQLKDARAEALSANDALNQASELTRGGDYRSAMRYLYLGALLTLDERGALRYDRSLTNREYLTQLRNQPALRDRLAPVVETFDRVWYGFAPVDAATLAQYRADVEALRNVAFERRPTEASTHA